jgi:archaellum biogenesis protein FlaJ (TadC family)
MYEFIQTNANVLWILAVFSLITFFVSLAVVPFLLIRIPSDYFSHKKRQRPLVKNNNPFVRGVFIVGKNVVGYMLIVLGITMLFMPGQGLLTVLLGIILIDFPGKYRFERWLVLRKHVLRSINWLRIRANAEPLVVDRHP